MSLIRKKNSVHGSLEIFSDSLLDFVSRNPLASLIHGICRRRNPDSLSNLRLRSVSPERYKAFSDFLCVQIVTSSLIKVKWEWWELNPQKQAMRDGDEICLCSAIELHSRVAGIARPARVYEGKVYEDDSCQMWSMMSRIIAYPESIDVLMIRPPPLVNLASTYES